MARFEQRRETVRARLQQFVEPPLAGRRVRAPHPKVLRVVYNVVNAAVRARAATARAVRQPTAMFAYSRH